MITDNGVFCIHFLLMYFEHTQETKTFEHCVTRQVSASIIHGCLTGQLSVTDINPANKTYLIYLCFWLLFSLDFWARLYWKISGRDINMYHVLVKLQASTSVSVTSHNANIQRNAIKNRLKYGLNNMNFLIERKWII